MMIAKMPSANRPIAISVVIATYNGERYLRPQLDSIVSQLTIADELVISDDRSTDSTMSILEDYVSDKVIIVETIGRLGPVRNFENALRHAGKDIVVLADQDDVWLPNRLEKIRAHFSARNTTFDLLVLDSEIVDGDLTPTQGSLFKLLSAGTGLFKNIMRNTYVGCHMAFRRELLNVALPFPSSIPMHDVWLGLVSESLGPVTFAPGKSMLFRRYGSNHTKARYPLRVQVAWRLGLTVSLLKLRIRRMSGTITRGQILEARQ